MESQNNSVEINKPKTKKPLVFIILTVLILSIVGLSAVIWWQNDQSNKQKSKDAATIQQLQADINGLKKQAAASPTPSLAPTPSALPTATSVKPSASALENIKAAFVSKNTAALEGYMAPSVYVVYAASEFAGNKTPTEAVKAMDYVNSGAVAPWNFNLDAATLASYKKGFYGKYFNDTTLVGRSSNGYVVAVNFDSSGKINGIFVSASDSLLV